MKTFYVSLFALATRTDITTAEMILVGAITVVVGILFIAGVCHHTKDREKRAANLIKWLPSLLKELESLVLLPGVSPEHAKRLKLIGNVYRTFSMVWASNDASLAVRAEGLETLYSQASDLRDAIEADLDRRQAETVPL